MVGRGHGQTDEPRGARAPTPEDILGQTRRILSNPEFAQSPRLQKFLTFIVEETLAGRGGTLKEYTIAIEVFGRDDSFDPQTSSIVRVEASRLRGKLDKYNAIDGRDDSVRIELPPGSYVPAFRLADRGRELTGRGRGAASTVRPQRLARRRVAALVAVVVAVGTTAFLLFDQLYPRPGTEPPPDAAESAKAQAIAVLPLRNLSGDPEQDFFSDGITDALIARLAKVSSLRVISMTSVMAYKDVNRPVADIAHELDVSHLVEGSVLRIGDRVRITAQFIEASADRHIWAETFERDVVDVLAIQEEVVRKVVASLSGRLASAANTGPAANPTIDSDAYEAILKGRYFRNKMTSEGFRTGVSYFQAAIEKAPDYAEAYSGMATCYCLLGGHGFELVEPGEGMPAAKAAVLEALRLDDSLAEAHAFLGIIRLKYEWDWQGAEASFKRSIEINPSYAQARVFYSYYLEAMGRQDEAVREAEVARSIDPLSLSVNVNLGWQYLQADRLEQARQRFESTKELDPAFWGAHWGLGHYYRRIGRYDQAVAAFRKAIEVGGGHTLPLTDLGYTYAISGKPAGARSMLARLHELAEEGYVSPYNMATIHVGLGETDDAITWLEKAFVVRSRSLAWLNVAGEFDGLRTDPRFVSLLHRIGLPG